MIDTESEALAARVRQTSQTRSSAPATKGLLATIGTCLRVATLTGLLVGLRTLPSWGQALVPVPSACGGPGTQSVGQPVVSSFIFYSSVGFGTTLCDANAFYAGAPGLVPVGTLRIWDLSSGDPFNPSNPPGHFFNALSMFLAATSPANVNVDVFGFLSNGNAAQWSFTLPGAPAASANFFTQYLFPASFTDINSLLFQYNSPAALDMGSITIADASGIPTTVTPEPSSIILLASGLGVLVLMRAVRRRARAG